MRFLKSSLFLLLLLCCFAKKQEVPVDNYRFYSTFYRGDEVIVDEKADMGSIEFLDYQLELPIRMGTSTKMLDQGYIGFLPLSYALDDDYGNVILAGHNRPNMFHILHQLKMGDIIRLKTAKKTFSFHVSKIDVVSTKDYRYFELSNYEKILTLVTCTDHDRKRLIIRAK